MHYILMKKKTTTINSGETKPCQSHHWERVSCGCDKGNMFMAFLIEIRTLKPKMHRIFWRTLFFCVFSFYFYHCITNFFSFFYFPILFRFSFKLLSFDFLQSKRNIIEILCKFIALWTTIVKSNCRVTNNFHGHSWFHLLSCVNNQYKWSPNR